MSITDICDADVITQGFGCTDYSAEWVRLDCAGGHFHAGIDLGYSDGGNNHLGAPVRSPRNGVVVAIGPVYPPNGAQYLGPYAVCIRTDAEGVIVEHGHLQAAHVAVGDRVRAGDRVGDLGTLGASNGGHLHLEVRMDAAIQGPPWAAVRDPGPWLHYLPQEVFLVALTDQQQADLYQSVMNCAAVLAKLDSRVLGDLPPAGGGGWGAVAATVLADDQLLAQISAGNAAAKAELDAIKAEFVAGGSVDTAAAIARIERALQSA